MSWWRRRKPETRAQGGDFYTAVLRTIEAEAATKTADSAATAAVEAAAGLLGRELAQARVKAPEWLASALSPVVLRQIGRELVTPGATLWRIDTTAGRVRLHPCGQWDWNGGHSADRDTWTVSVTESGPAGTVAYLLADSGVVYVDWSHRAMTPWAGLGPLDRAAITARLAANAERSLSHDMAANVAYPLPVPAAGAAAGDDDGEPAVDPADQLAADLAAAAGKTVIVETTSDGFGEGGAAAPRRDWETVRHGPSPPIANAEIARDAFARTLAACGVPPALFMPNADGTALQHSMRRYRLNVVEPVARILEAELTAKLETSISLKFDPLMADLQVRAQAAERLTKMGMSPALALEVARLVFPDDDTAAFDTADVPTI
ncbi:MAG: hypothetical protein OXG57_11150 [Acidimicrobiaceae bacterium]|nr:hypothetical protein [Acidimicrobiaceae bacterium]